MPGLDGCRERGLRIADLLEQGGRINDAHRIRRGVHGFYTRYDLTMLQRCLETAERLLKDMTNES